MLTSDPTQSLQQPAVPSWLSLPPRLIVWLSLAAGGGVAVAGSLGEVSLGDENVHIRQARTFTTGWRRLPFDPVSVFPDRCARHPFNGTPLWHMGLGALWRAAGSRSEALAQGYQACFYVLLVLSVYFAVRAVWGQGAATWAWLLAATMPMVCAYSVLLYQDVPGVALAALALALLLRRRFLLCGLGLAAAYMTKMNMLTFAPWAAVFALWWAKGRWWQRLLAAGAVAAPVAAGFAGDMAWRQAHYDSVLAHDIYPGAKEALPKSSLEALSALPERYTLWKPYPFHNPKAIASHLGVLGLLGVAAALRYAWNKLAVWLWGCVALGIAGFYLIFVRMDATQVRYLFPAVLVLIMLASVGLARVKAPRAVVWIAIVGCGLQAAGTLAFLGWKRRIPAGEREAFAWIRANTDPTTRVMYPEEALTNHADRRAIWEILNPAYLTTDATDEDRHEIFRFFRISHVVIPRRRTYDRAREGDHGGGYPKDFVEKAHSLPYLEEVFDNGDMIIFRFTHPPATTGPAPGEISPRRPPATPKGP